MLAIKDKIPLHYTKFRQTASHISREADVESLLSLDIWRSYTKSCVCWRPDVVGELSCYEPTIEEIWEDYKAKYGVHDGGDLWYFAPKPDETDDEGEWLWVEWKYR